METMKIWDAVSKTDPNHTKTVSIGRKFTAIDAHYQIMSATQQFGAVGVGWGYDVEHSTITAGSFLLAVADVTIWHGSRANKYGPIRGVTEMIGAKGRLDDDAPKKATTDALTKGLSHLGFNADVFLGKFDDNKYVNDLRKEFSSEVKSEVSLEDLEVAITESDSIESLQKVFAASWKKASALQQQKIKVMYDKRKTELS